eukprot:scaffold236_cov138-Skeletonema_marinoi.AAC.2
MRYNKGKLLFGMIATAQHLESDEKATCLQRPQRILNKAVYDNNTNLKLSRSSADVDVRYDESEVGRVHPSPSFDDCCASDSQ